MARYWNCFPGADMIKIKITMDASIQLPHICSVEIWERDYNFTKLWCFQWSMMSTEIKAAPWQKKKKKSRHIRFSPFRKNAVKLSFFFFEKKEKKKYSFLRKKMSIFYFHHTLSKTTCYKDEKNPVKSVVFFFSNKKVHCIIFLNGL